MSKYLLLLLIVGNFHLCFAQPVMDFTVTYSGNQGSSSGQGDVGSQAQSNGPNTAQQASEQLQQSAQRSINSINLYDLSIAQAEILVKENIRQSINRDVEVHYNYARDKTNEFRKQVIFAKEEFNSHLFRNVSHPSFDSHFFGKKIHFDRDNEGDRQALHSYRSAIYKQTEQLGANQAYHTAEFSKHVIETRQFFKSSMSPRELSILNNLAKSINSEDQKSLIESLSELISISEFARGFSASILNNLNPLGDIYPLNPNCETSISCQVGSKIGDATSLLLGIYEMFQGATIASLGIGSGFGVLVASPATAGSSLYLIPTASIPMTMAGVAMAGHGLETVTASIESLHKNADSTENHQQVSKSKDKIEDLSQLKIETHLGSKVNQEMSAKAIKARQKVKEGAKLYRTGTRGSSMTGKQAQFWSLENPKNLDYADRYGLPPDNIVKLDFIETGHLKEKGNFITRRAPGVGNHKGGEIEVVVEEGGVIIESHISLEK